MPQTQQSAGASASELTKMANEFLAQHGFRLDGQPKGAGGGSVKMIFTPTGGSTKYKIK